MKQVLSFLTLLYALQAKGMEEGLLKLSIPESFKNFSSYVQGLPSEKDKESTLKLPTQLLIAEGTIINIKDYAQDVLDTLNNLYIPVKASPDVDLAEKSLPKLLSVANLEVYLGMQNKDAQKINILQKDPHDTLITAIIEKIKAENVDVNKELFINLDRGLQKEITAVFIDIGNITSELIKKHQNSLPLEEENLSHQKNNSHLLCFKPSKWYLYGIRGSEDLNYYSKFKIYDTQNILKQSIDIPKPITNPQFNKDATYCLAKDQSNYYYFKLNENIANFIPINSSKDAKIGFTYNNDKILYIIDKQKIKLLDVETNEVSVLPKEFSYSNIDDTQHPIENHDIESITAELLPEKSLLKIA